MQHYKVERDVDGKLLSYEYVDADSVRNNGWFDVLVYRADGSVVTLEVVDAGVPGAVL